MQQSQPDENKTLFYIIVSNFREQTKEDKFIQIITKLYLADEECLFSINVYLKVASHFSLVSKKKSRVFHQFKTNPFLYDDKRWGFSDIDQKGSSNRVTATIFTS
jgi:hypothetical protein